MSRVRLIGFALLLVASMPLAAEVIHSSEGSFAVTHAVETNAEPFVVYRTMTSHINEWWNEEHSWSGDAANLYMNMEIGDCFCERLPNGGNVEHLRIIYFSPGEEIRFDGALGPLQQMAVNGRMTWKIEATETGSTVSFTYQVNGFMEGGLNQIAPAVDGVIGEQLSRLAKRQAGSDFDSTN